MIRILLVLLTLVALSLCVAWYSSQTLPSWYQSDVSQQEKLVTELSEKINSQGVGEFLGNKLADIVSGQLVLSEVEFNALLLSSLQSSQDGRRVLAVSDAVKAQLNDGNVEVGAVIDLHKVAQTSEEAREAVENLNKALPLLDRSKIFLSVSGQPIARNGEISFDEDFSVKIGAIPISSKLLAQLGVPVHKASESSLPLKYLLVKSIALTKGEVVLEVRPSFQ
ncbi:MAG: hypothetical protein KTR16_12100 [Acidiferrobacterales bacterium]|nr:hypothetical protein [Acidiferrobacterales bacterium]